MSTPFVSWTAIPLLQGKKTAYGGTMAEIRLDNSFCKLVGFPDSVLKTVRSTLTYTDEEVIKQKQGLFHQMQKARSRRQGGYVAILKEKFKALGPDQVCWLDADNSFPTGLLHLVKDIVNTTTYSLVDKRSRPEASNIFRWNNKPSDLRYYQEEAAAEFVRKGRGVFQMAVGSGKTRAAVEVIKQLSVNTCFVVPSTALLTQAYDVFEHSFGAKNVQKINTADVKKNKKLKPIRVVTIQTLASLNKQGIAGTLLGDVDLLILDECHHSGSESFTKLLPQFQNIYYRLGLSGTYLRNDSKTLDLWGVCGQVIFDYSAKRATEESYLTPVEFNVVKLKGKPNIKYQTEYKDNYGGLELLTSIGDIVQTKIPNDKQILILVDRKESCGALIHEFLKEKGIKSTWVNGDDSKEAIASAIEDFNDKKIRVLVASQILGEGCDIRSTDHLIMARGGKSEIAMTQAVGRAVRLYENKKTAYVWDFNFRFCKYLPRHLDIRLETYEKQFSGKISYL